MADEKGGSDLDVFEGLAKKSPRSAIPGLTPPPPTQARQRTLLGGLGGLPPPPTTIPGAGAPPPLPPPPPASGPLPPVTPPPMRGSAATLPPVVPPPARPPTSTPLPPPPMSGPPPISALPPVMPPPARPPVKPPGEEPKPRAGGKGPAVDMDWDDEEESTHVYDKQTQDAVGAPAGPRPAAGAPPMARSAAALLASSGGAAAPAMRHPSAVPQPPPIPGMPPPLAPALSAPPSRRNEEATAIRPRPVVQTGGGSKAGVILGGLALLAVIGLAVFLLLPRKGDLKIDVKAPNGATIAKAEVFVDGQKRCDTVPCVVRGLDSGSKTVKVIAPDLPPQDAVEVVESGKEKFVLIDLAGASGTVPASGATGFKAASTQQGVKVIVDGAEKGTLPVELALPPGSHKVQFEGGERYQKREETIEVLQGQMKDIGNVALKVLKGQVTLELVTQGAAVTLVNAKGTEKRLPDALWRTPPVKLDIDPAEGWKLVARKKGFEDFSQPLTFDDGQAEKTVRIEMAEAGKGGPAVGGPVPGPGPGPGPGPAPGPGPQPPVASGNGTLNINSIPVSKVVLDGRPLGSTPKVGVSVPAGSHTVTFIHPEHGKKSISVTVKPGETKTAAVKFK